MKIQLWVLLLHISVTHHLFCVDLTLAHLMVHGQDLYIIVVVSVVKLLGSILLMILGVVVNMVQTTYVVKEGDGLANVTVLLNQPSCITATVIVVPQLQSPRDARSNLVALGCFIKYLL